MILPAQRRFLILKGVVALVLTLIILGTTLETIGARRDRTRFPQIGRSIDIGGRTLNLYCSGTGSPTVVFETGAGMPGYSWLLVQRPVAEFTRACWYDRPGFGWSDQGPDHHWGDSVAKELHQLLNAADVRPPYVLVGHSVGGYFVRLYYKRFPDEVAGIVLVDPTAEGTDTRNPSMPKTPNIPRPLARAGSVIGYLGLSRVMTSVGGSIPRGISKQEWETIRFLRRQPKSLVGGIHEWPFTETEREVQRDRSLTDVPLVVLSAEHAAPGIRHEAQIRNIELHEEISHLSTRGHHVTLRTGHMIPYEAPEAVVSAVRSVLSEAKTTVPSTGP